MTALLFAAALAVSVPAEVERVDWVKPGETITLAPLLSETVTPDGEIIRMYGPPRTFGAIVDAPDIVPAGVQDGPDGTGPGASGDLKDHAVPDTHEQDVFPVNCVDNAGDCGDRAEYACGPNGPGGDHGGVRAATYAPGSCSFICNDGSTGTCSLDPDPGSNPVQPPRIPARFDRR